MSDEEKNPVDESQVEKNDSVESKKEDTAQKSEEIASEQEEKVDSKKETNTESNTSQRNVLIAFGIGFVLILILLVGAIVLINNNNNEGQTAQVNIDAENNIEEFDQVANASINTVIEAINAKEFDPERPLDIIDFSAMQEGFNNISSELDFLQGVDQTTLDIAGKTVHEAVEFSYDLSGMSAMKMIMNLDVYTKYAEDYDASKYTGLTFSELINLSSNMTEEEYLDLFMNQDIYMEGVLSVTQSKNDAELDFDLYVIDGVAFVRINSITNEGVIPSNSTDEVSSIVGEYIRFDLSELLKLSFENNQSQMDAVANEQLMEFVSAFEDLSTFPETEAYDELNGMLAEMFGDMSEEELALFKSVMPGILDSVSNNFKDLSLFINSKSTDPIRSQSNSACTTAEFNTDGLMTAVKEIVTDSYDIITTDSNFNDPSYDVETEREGFIAGLQQLNMFKEMLNMDVTVCNDKDKNYNTGFGVDMNVDYGFGTGLSFVMDYLTVSFDVKDVEIAEPEYTQDYTEQLNDMINNYGSMMSNPYSNDITNDSYAGEDFSYELSQEEQELFDKYINDEITLDEYIDGIDALNNQ